jgi:hypothetical protein
VNVVLKTALPSKRQRGVVAHTSARTVLNSMLRAATRARRSTSAWFVDVGLARSDWQMPPTPQMNRAQKLFRNSSYSPLTRGMLATRTFVSGEPAASVARACSNWARNAATDVIWASVSVQRSLPPTRIVR